MQDCVLGEDQREGQTFECGTLDPLRTASDSRNGYHLTPNCLGGAVVGRRTRDRKITSLTPGRGAIKSTIGQLSLPSIGVGKSSTSLWLGL